jgi:hypothetical protein
MALIPGALNMVRRLWIGWFLAGVKLFELGQQLLTGLLVGRVRNGCAKGADFGALGSLMIANALGALGGVNLVYDVPLADGLVWALKFAGTASGALISYFVSHGCLLRAPVPRAKGRDRLAGAGILSMIITVSEAVKPSVYLKERAG